MAPPRKPHKDEVTPAQRALWTFLAATLIGPFLAALAFLAVALVGGIAGYWPPGQRLLAGQLVPIAVERSVGAFVWSAFPAGVAGAIAAAWLSLTGGLPWLVFAVAAAVAATIATIMAGGLVGGLGVTVIAFIAAVSGIGVWALLRRARILPRDPA